MTWVKICGITTEEALEAAEAGGADAVGFVIAPTSPRFLPLEAIHRMIARTTLPAYLVSVDASPAEIVRAMGDTGADGIQPHGREGREVAAEALGKGWSVLFPVPVGGSRNLRPHDIPHGVVPLLDTASDAVHGGTGTTFDWRLIDDSLRPFVLAGGLGVDNVATAIRTVRPHGVDASSRLERVTGRKDPDTIRAFIEEAKSA